MLVSIISNSLYYILVYNTFVQSRAHFRISLNVMTLKVTSNQVNSTQGVPISVTGIAQVAFVGFGPLPRFGLSYVAKVTKSAEEMVGQRSLRDLIVLLPPRAPRVNDCAVPPLSGCV